MASSECSVCLNEFRDPRVLSCGHTFCLLCIEVITRGNRVLKCPQCRQVYTGFTTAAAIPRNITANDLIEELRRTRLSAANANVGTTVASSTLNVDENTNVINCKECSHNRAIDDLLVCPKHNFWACARCCALKHNQCILIAATEHARNVLLEDKESLDNVERLLNKSSERLAQDTNVARLKQWADALKMVHAVFEGAYQLIQNRLRDLCSEVSSHKGLVDDLMTSKVNAAAIMYSGDWANVDKLVAKCAVFTELDLVKVAGIAEDNLVRRLGKLDKPMFPVLDEELANINVDALLRQITDKLDLMQTRKRSFCVIQCNNGRIKFSKLNECRSAWVALPPPPRQNSFSVASCADKLYIVGGQEKAAGTGQATNLVQTYNMRTGWQACSHMLEQRRFCGTAAMGDRLFAVGGRGWNEEVLSSAEEYDLQLDRWTLVTPMTAARYGLGVATLSNLLFAVGGCGSSYLNTAEFYDPRDGKWTKTKPMKNPRFLLACAVLGDRLYVAGGLTANEKWTASVEGFDFRTLSWVPEPDMGAARAAFALTALNEQLLVAGGWMSTTNSLDTVEVYDKKHKAWSTLDAKLPLGGRCAGFVLEE